MSFTDYFPGNFIETDISLDFSIQSSTSLTLLICTLLSVSIILRFLFWKLSPVVYETALLAVFYGIGKIVHALDKSSELETAIDFVGVHTVHMIIPVYIFRATFDFNTAFGSYLFMYTLLISLIPVFVFNLYFISWVMYVVFQYSLTITFQEMLIITLILSPCQVQYILDYLESAQGRISELQFRMHTEHYSSLWQSFFIAGIVWKTFSSEYRLSVFMITIFILYQLLGIVVGLIIAKVVSYALKKAATTPSLTVVLTIASLYLVQTISVLVGTSHILAVGMFGIHVNSLVDESSPETAEFFTEFWKMVLFVVNSIAVALIGIFIGFSDTYSEIDIFRIVLIFYTLFLAVRLLLFFMVYPVVTIAMGRVIDWRYAAIQVSGVYKGGPNYIMALYYGLSSSRNGFAVVEIVTCFTLMSQFFNVLLFPTVLRMLGMYGYSSRRVADMNIAVSDINNCREKAIFALKLDKMVTDANWLVVERMTRLNHPYKTYMDAAGLDDDRKQDQQLRSVICPDCKTELIAPLTDREIANLRKEARERIIKTLQMSFHRQYRNGSLTTHEFDFLNSIIESEMSNIIPRLQPEKLQYRSASTRWFAHLKRALTWFSNVTADAYYFIPIGFRFRCFMLSISSPMQILLALVILGDTTLTISMVIFYYQYYKISKTGEFEWNQSHWKYSQIAQNVHMAFYSAYVLACMVQLFGVGFSQYFSKNVSKIEFGCGIVLGTLEVALYARACVASGHCVHPFQIHLIMLIKSTMPLRLAKLYILMVALLPKIISSVNHVLSQEMMMNYELGKAYLVALTRVTALMNQIDYYEPVYTELMKEIEADRLYVSRELGLIQKENPEIASTVKTRHAIRHVVNAMGECIKDIKEEGVVDLIEAKEIHEALNKKTEMLRELTIIMATPPEGMLRNVVWLKDEHEKLQYLLREATLSNYDYGEVIIRSGDDPIGIYLLVSGLLRSMYTPSSVTLQLSNKFGVLPNYDFFNNIKFDQPQESYVVSGSVIGEIAAVTGRRFDMTIDCETAVQVYFIPWDAIKTIIHESSNSLQMISKIWKSISIKIALNILQYYVVNFQGWSTEKLLMFLNKGFVPIMPDMVGINISANIDLIMLIEGVLMDHGTRKVYTGPCHIPKNIHRLILPEHDDWNYQTICESRMLIVPSNITDEEELRSSSDVFIFKHHEKEDEDEPPHLRKVGFDEQSDIIDP